jgi:hypothetical protein
MMQIWKLENWDTLYNSIYAFAETEWYRRLGASLSGECQELLVGVLADNGECNRPAWKSDSEPGYSYLYEEVMPNPGDTHSYLRDLNWLSAQVASAEFGWKRAWTATHVTSRPSLISVLWRVPSVGSIDTTLARISSEKPYAQRYAQMMGNLRELTRQSFHPIYTERLDERIRAGEKSPLIKR